MAEPLTYIHIFIIACVHAYTHAYILLLISVL